MKNKMKLNYAIKIFLFLLISSFSLNAQSSGYYYSYDDSGNRIERIYSTIFLRPAIEADDTISIKTKLADYDISIYPNPTESNLNIEINNLPDKVSVNYRGATKYQ